MFDSLQPHGLCLIRCLCPWDCPGKNTETDCHFLLQRIFQTLGSNPCLASPALAGGSFSTSTTWEALNMTVQFSSVQFSLSVVSNSLQPHGLQHTRLSCPSPTPGVYSNSCPLSRWCHQTISSSVIPFSSYL